MAILICLCGVLSAPSVVHAVPANLNIIIGTPAPDSTPVPDPAIPPPTPEEYAPEPRPGGGATGSWILRSRSLRTAPSVVPTAPAYEAPSPTVNPVAPVFPVRPLPTAAPPSRPSSESAAAPPTTSVGTTSDTAADISAGGTAGTAHPVRISADNGFSAEIFVERLDMTSYGVFGTHPVVFPAALTLIINMAAMLYPYRRRNTMATV